MAYIFAFDVSMSSTGLCIFTERGIPEKITSIQTNSKDEHKDRLKTIADSVLELRNIYPTSLMVYESGFSRYSASTQAIYKSLGIIQYLFYDCEQKSYAPSTVRKIVCGNGRADKKDVERTVLKYWPNLSFQNDDESDACGVALCWLIDNNIKI